MGLTESQYFTMFFNTSGVRQKTVIERDLPTLSKDDLIKYSKEVHEAQRKELERWISMKCFSRMLKRDATNRIDSRWVLKFKIVDGKREVKARLVVRGFKDAEADSLTTFAGTATRWGQRMICSIAAQYQWRLWSADISMAFLRGLTFEEIAKTSGEPIRSIQFDLPNGANALLQTFDGFSDFNALAETLNMDKPGFGTKDAPWAWGIKHAWRFPLYPDKGRPSFLHSPQHLP